VTTKSHLLSRNFRTRYNLNDKYGETGYAVTLLYFSVLVSMRGGQGGDGMGVEREGDGGRWDGEDGMAGEVE